MAGSNLVLFVVLTFVESLLGCPIGPGGDSAPNTVVEIFSDTLNLTIIGLSADFGPCAVNKESASIKVVRLPKYQDGDGTNSTLACQPMEDFGGAIAFAIRGECSFFNKTRNVLAAGASMILIGDSGDGNGPMPIMGCPAESAADCANLSIPAVAIPASDARRLANLLTAAAAAAAKTDDGGSVVAAAGGGGSVTARVYYRERPMLDASSLVIWSIATATVAAGSFLASKAERQRAAGGKFAAAGGGGGEGGGGAEETLQELGMVHALGFLVVSSVVLVLLFYFIQSVILFILLVYCVSAASAMAAVASEPLAAAAPPLRRPVRLACLEPEPAAMFVSLAAAATLAAVWFFNRHAGWAVILQDLMSVCLCLQILSTVRFSNVKVCTTLLSLALVYDVFWVFISPVFFSQSVMIGVATGQGAQLGNSSAPAPRDTLPMLIVVPRLQDWSGGSSLLGLGDIVLPGILVAFGLRMDYVKGASARHGYFLLLLGGYAVGLLMAIGASVVMRQGQPALLYLVPCTLAPFLLLAWRRGHLREMWHGVASPASSDSTAPADPPTESDSDGLHLPQTECRQRLLGNVGAA